MRLWLKDSERRPDPEPVKTDDRKAMLIGLALWSVALVVMLFFVPTLMETGRVWWLWTCVAGVLLGFVGLFYTKWRNR